MEKPNGFVCGMSLIHQHSPNNFWPAGGRVKYILLMRVCSPVAFSGMIWCFLDQPVP